MNRKNVINRIAEIEGDRDRVLRLTEMMNDIQLLRMCEMMENAQRNRGRK